MNFEIPKEIKAKPKIFGLEMKELIIVVISFFLVFTMLKDLVHSVFMIPYFIMSGFLIIWTVMKSRNNPLTRNYMSIYYFFKRDKDTYHPMDVQKVSNRVFTQPEKVKGENVDATYE